MEILLPNHTCFTVPVMKNDLILFHNRDDISFEYMEQLSIFINEALQYNMETIQQNDFGPYR